ncbi:hypothetical protein MMC31_005331 [Peltigera leucophlebia]|nr:hypothetical protein [Peltigera leucophlebia]
MTVSLLTLPGEILDLILVLPNQDLSVLSRVCKPLRQLMLPRLYEDIRLTWTMELTGNTQIHFFVQSLLKNSHLCALVKHFSCVGEPNMEVLYADRSPGTFWEEGVTKTLEDGKLVIKAKEVLFLENLPQPLWWIDALEMGNVNTFVALLLSQVLQLRTLHLDAHFITDNELIGLLFKHVLSPKNQNFPLRGLSTALADLHHVEIMAPLPEEPLPTEGFVDAAHDNPPCASYLRTLNLPNCEVDEEGLERVLAVTPKLERLSYHRLSYIDSAEGYQTPHLDLTRPGKALVQVRATLRHLSLSILFSTWDDDEYYGTNGPPFLFKSFDKLEYLEIPFVILFGKYPGPFSGLENLLPQFLRHLCLRDDMATSTYYEWKATVCLAMITQLLAYRDRLAPCLESITLRLRESEESEWDEIQQDELRRLCCAAGLGCSISKVLPDR